ncbi:winged helix-turn-helix domain-containing protein [uncultured Paludibaculum sp.]|uniref:winged helix-turn-helix domain-containing protein n=1 Tax=uncultured Paludibaculum sp. TaxID=1765020 RepID=UPI002AAB1E66|nr:winged helix-turn-helix domain-containing protein [uncultured Paludibaculum sp.]
MESSQSKSSAPSRDIAQYRFGAYELDVTHRQLSRDGAPVPLASKVLDTLIELVRHRDAVMTREELLAAIWPDVNVEDSNLTQNIFVLRKALEQPGGERLIVTVPGKGYRFVSEVTEIHAHSAAEPAPSPQPAGTPASPTRRSWVLLAAAVLIVLGAAIGYLALRRDSLATPAPAARFLTSLPGNENQPALSPDGTLVAFSWNGEDQDNYDIYIKGLAAETPVRLTSQASEETSPVWSADGRRLAFVRLSPAGGAIYTIDAHGGDEKLIAPIFSQRFGFRVRHLDWSPDGASFAVDDKSNEEDTVSIFLVSAAGGARQRLTSPPARSTSDLAPRFSPDGKQVAFIRSIAPHLRAIYLVPTAGGGPRRITADLHWIGDLDWSPDGRELIYSTDRSGTPALWRTQAVPGSTPQPLRPSGENAQFVSLSRRKGNLAYTQAVTDINIWRLRLPVNGEPAGEWTRLLNSTREDSVAHYSPDGKHIGFRSDRSGVPALWLSDAQGHQPLQLLKTGALAGTVAWSPDSRTIAYDVLIDDTLQLLTVPASGGKPTQITFDRSSHVLPQWSPDGRNLYYSSNQSGTWQVWRIPASGGSSTPVTRQGGCCARFSPDGKTIYYAKGYSAGGIWKTPAEGGVEEVVIPEVQAEYWGFWAVVEKGIYFLGGGTPGVPPPPPINFYDFNTRRTTTIAHHEKPGFLMGAYSYSISPDRRYLLTSQLDTSGSDIMLIDAVR